MCVLLLFFNFITLLVFPEVRGIVSTALWDEELGNWACVTCWRAWKKSVTPNPVSQLSVDKCLVFPATPELHYKEKHLWKMSKFWKKKNPENSDQLMSHISHQMRLHSPSVSPIVTHSPAQRLFTSLPKIECQEQCTAERWAWVMRGDAAPRGLGAEIFSH